MVYNLENSKKIFIDVCYEALKKQDHESGAMPGGHNGPYIDIHSPVRNTSHWAISFIKAFEITNDDKFKISAKKCLDYLLPPNDYRTNYTFIHRMKNGKDRENGTIGTAWNIEALVIGFIFFKDENYLKLAKALFNTFKFDAKYHLWLRSTPDGRIYSIDRTFNHQLWFAASALMLYKVSEDKDIKEKVDLFFASINKFFKVSGNGRIIHGISIYDTWRSFAIYGIRKYRHLVKGLTMKYKENGYHAFNLYAFAIIKELGYYLDFFRSDRFRKALNFNFSKDYLDSLEDRNHQKDTTKLKLNLNLPFNRYGFSYNAPGFEVPYIYKVFKDDIKSQFEMNDIWQKQILFNYNDKNKDFSRNTEDEITLTARIYEFSRVF